MNELKDECYKCLNNRNCLGGAEYGSLYCMMNRKYKIQNEDDSVYAHKFATMQKQIDEKDKRIQELETEIKNKDTYIKMAKEVIENSITKQKIKDEKEVLRKMFKATTEGILQEYTVEEIIIKMNTLEELLEEK